MSDSQDGMIEPSLGSAVATYDPAALGIYDPAAIFVTDPDDAALCAAARDITGQLAVLMEELQTLRCTRVFSERETEALLQRQFNRIRDALAILSSIVDDIERPFP